MPRFPNFVGPSYTSQSRIADGERCVNWFPEPVESAGGKAAWVLYPTPGLDLVCTLADAPVRGLWSQNGRTLAVGGAHLYELDRAFAVTSRGSGLATRENRPVTFSSNGDGGHQVFFTAGGRGYLYDLIANTLTQVLDSASQGGFIDGFFVALDPQTSTLLVSDLENGLVWDPLQIAQRNSSADRWAALLVVHKEIWLFGSEKTDVYYNAGASPFPFLPNPSVQIAQGIGAPSSAAVLDGAPIWLGQSADGDRVVYRANGYAPQRVSTYAVEYALSTYATVSDAEGWTYQEQGHNFYVLTFPSADATWVYDAGTGAWHERGAWDGHAFTALPVGGHAFANGVHLVGDRVSGKIYRMGTDLASDGGGRTLRRLRRAPHLGNEGGRVTFSSFQLDLEMGLGLSSGQGSDPQVMLRWSDDGGQTWGNEHWVSAGRQGSYKARAIWRRLGQTRDRVFEVSTSDPIPWRVIDAYLQIRPGAVR